MKPGRTTVLRAVTVAAASLVVACGSEAPHVQPLAASPLAEASVAFRQTGDAQASIDPKTVTYRLDDARLLVINLGLRSTAPTAQTVGVRGSLYDTSGRLIGDATGSDINVQPGATVQLILSGPHPNGVIASATFEVHLSAAATP